MSKYFFNNVYDEAFDILNKVGLRHQQEYDPYGTLEIYVVIDLHLGIWYYEESILEIINTHIDLTSLKEIKKVLITLKRDKILEELDE